jgi:hypothetical protein
VPPQAFWSGYRPDSVFQFDIGFPISQHNLDFSVTLLVYTVTVNKLTIGQQ